MTEELEPPVLCDDCGGPALEEHSMQGFGHYRRCCGCYEKRQCAEESARDK